MNVVLFSSPSCRGASNFSSATENGSSAVELQNARSTVLPLTCADAVRGSSTEDLPTQTSFDSLPDVTRQRRPSPGASGLNSAAAGRHASLGTAFFTKLS